MKNPFKKNVLEPSGEARAPVEKSADIDEPFNVPINDKNDKKIHDIPDDRLYNDDEEFDEVDKRLKNIREKSENVKQKKPPMISDQEERIQVTRERVVRDLDKINLPRTTTQVMDYLPTIAIVKLQMLRHRRERKIIDETIRVNLREENDEFNEETEEEASNYEDDDYGLDLDNLDLDDDI